MSVDMVNGVGVCSTCGKHDAALTCSRCSSAFYCDSSCQRTHWPAHKEPCKAVVKAVAMSGCDKIATSPVTTNPGSADYVAALSRGDAGDAAGALVLYERAAEVGHAVAALRAGTAHATGEGTVVDAVEAVRWYTRAAVANNAEAQLALGLCLLSGEGVETDARAATTWLARAAAAGSDAASLQLGLCYDAGTGVVADKVKAAKWFERAAEGSDADTVADAHFQLASLLDLGEGGVELDEARAYRLYTLAAKAGHEDAMFNLGVCYLHGEGVEAQPDEAVKWWRRAADNGHDDAMYNVGICYDNGTGVIADKIEALKWYKQAARKGENMEALFAIGLCYEEGSGVSANAKEAAHWFGKATALGHAEAADRLAELKRESAGAGAATPRFPRPSAADLD